MRNKIIYVAGCYYSSSKEGTIININLSKEIAIKIWNLGATAISPHLNSFLFDYEPQNITKYEGFIEGDLNIIKQCDALYMLKGWSKSKGAKIEYDFAIKNKIPVLYTESQLKKFIEKDHNHCFNCKKIRLDMVVRNTYNICQNCIETAKMIEDKYFFNLNKTFIILPKNV